MPAQKDVYVRLSVKDAQAAQAALRKFGTDGQSALRKIDRAAKKPSRSLKALNTGVKTGTTSLQRMGQTAAIIDGPLGGIASRFTGLGSLISGAGLAIGSFALGLAGAVTVLGKGIQAANEYEKSMFKIQAVLNTTGFASGKTADEINELSIAIGRGTLASVNGVRNAAAQLLTFRNISGEAFDRTLIAAQDLAALGFGTIESAAVQLAKAMEDPARGLTMLRRVGVSFTAAQEQVIKKLFETGQVAAAQNEILKAVEAQVAGAGTAEAGGLAGAYDTLTENIGLFLEGVGNSGPIQVATQAMLMLGESIGALNDSFFPPAIIRIAELKKEIADLEAEINKPGGITDLDATGTLGLDITVSSQEAELAKKRKELADLVAEEEAEAERKRFARKRAEEEKYRAQVEADHTRLFKAEEAFVKKLERETKREKKARVDATKRATAEIIRLEDRAAKATLDPIALVARERRKELDKYKKMRADGLISVRQHAEAEVNIAKIYGKRRLEAEKEVQEELKKARAETFGGAAQNEVEDYFDTLGSAGERTGRFLVSSFSQVEDALTAFYSGAKVSGADFLDSMKAGLARLAAQDTIAAVGGFLGLGSGSGGLFSGGSIIGNIIGGVGSLIGGFFADGGRVSGPGSGTSDSIPAWVSNGEFIVNARSTARWLPFLEAINDAPGFARGGRVGADGIPRFAFGGMGGDFDDGAFGGDPGNDEAGRGDLADPGTGPEAPGGDFDDNYRVPDDIVTNIFDRYGNIVDRRGGSFFDRIATFFGAGQDAGLLGSPAAGLLSLLVGLFNPLAGLGLNIGREALTGGKARNSGITGTGLVGLGYDLITGQTTVDQELGRLSRSFDRGVGSIASAMGIEGVGAVHGSRSRAGAAVAGFGGEGGDFFFSALDDRPEERRSAFQAAGSLALAGFRGDLASRYQPVESTGANILASLSGSFRRGGRPPIGEDVLVGEAGPEVFRADRPGKIFANDNVTFGSDNSEVVEVLEGIREDLAEGNRSTALAIEELRSQVHALSDGTRGRRTQRSF